DIASILSTSTTKLLDTINVVGLGVTGKSFFMHLSNKVQDFAFFSCKGLHFYFAIHSIITNDIIFSNRKS
ncbi:hypothetical protein, partial [Metabacillus niabensis]|uniref:hypothetical protein n=1 Tax=Metabacillus niabensis TaxID=324854 RepID=UPI0039A0E64B